MRLKWKERQPEFNRRLMREGRFAEYHERHIDLRRKLQAQGSERRQASHRAWMVLRDDYPRETDEPIVDGAKLEERARRSGRRHVGGSAEDAEVTLPMQFVPSGMFEGKKCSVVESIEWALERLAWKHVSPEDAPSGTAWTLYSYARRSPEARAQFIKTFVTKLLPNRSQIESGEKLRDDGREHISFIKRIRAARAAGEFGRESGPDSGGNGGDAADTLGGHRSRPRDL
jgi:hypothetical protein